MTPEQDDRPPRPGRRLLLRACLGGLVVILLTAGATATAGLLQVKNLADEINHLGGRHIGATEITPAEAGQPQTILVLGSDQRYGDHQKGIRPRSDTLMLIRLDPNQQATAVMSIPRDLKVDIPGHGVDKINAAYSVGGPDLTLRTVKALLGIKVNHVVNVAFRGFRAAVNEIGCVYVDVDRRYYHSNVGIAPVGQYAEIDIPPGYQRLCGQKALDYVRFRHTDSDIIRAARQQDFLRDAKDQVSTSSLFDDRSKLLKIFARSTQTDKDLGSTAGLLKLMKLSLFSAGHPVREIQFPFQYESGPQSQYVLASPDAISKVVTEFMHARASKQPRKTQGQTPKSLGPPRGGKGGPVPKATGLVDARRQGENLVAGIVARHQLPFPLYFPGRLTAQGQYTTVQPSPRVYTLRDRAGKLHHAYRLVVVQNELEGQYYGVQATDWRTPPILSRASSTLKVGSRRLLLYRDGQRLRLVAWRTPRAVYWVSNTLSLQLKNSQMIGIARSLVRFGGHG
jgi:polyisoprenyl-teichoic acid--peptidoglycan teichoic acid transferase